MTTKALACACLVAAANAFAAPFAYIPNEQGVLAVLDIGTGAMVKTIAVGPGSYGMAMTPTGDRVYLTDETDNKVRVVNTATNSLVATISVCGTPLTPGMNPAGTRLAVPCRGGDAVDIIDTATNTVVAHAGGLFDPSVAVWNPAGTRLYVANTAQALISVFDGATLAPLGTIDAPFYVVSMAFNSTGTRLYAASISLGFFGTNVISVIDPQTNGTVATIPMPSRPLWLALNPSGTRLFATQPETDSLAIVDTADNTVIANINTGHFSNPVAVNVSADASRIYVQIAGAGDLAVLDGASLVRLATIDYGVSGQVYGTFVTPTSNAHTPGVLSGQWWNHNESGWGIHLTERGNTIFAAWYTYDAGGNPKWYVSTCTKSSGLACAGSVLQVTGPRFFGVPFNPSAVSATPAGNLAINFTGIDSGTFAYSVNGVSRQVAIERQVLQASGASPATNYTDLWWGGASESGWGLAITHQFTTMFLAWYVYGDTGEPVWYVATIANATATGGSGTLFRTTGPPFSTSFNPGAVQSFAVGSVTLSFTDGDNGTLSYTVNNATGQKTITRQLF